MHIPVVASAARESAVPARESSAVGLVDPLEQPNALNDAFEQPNALVDTLGRPLSDLRISVMDRCNFRCPYCMPREQYHENYQFLPSAERLQHAEIVRAARLFAGLGVRKLRITGGEPLLLGSIVDLIADLTVIPGISEVALTTNGSLLSKHAEALKDAGLKRVTVSLDSTDPEVFKRMTGGFGNVQAVIEGIERARAVGLGPIKINAVLQRGVNDHTALELIEHFRGTGVIVRFIEYMDVGNKNHWRSAEVVPTSELHARIQTRWPLKRVPSVQPGEVATRYVIADARSSQVPDELGFVSSVSQPFCRDCSRARLSSDGKLYTCLFASHGTDLRGALRTGASDAAVSELIAHAWRARADRYSELRSLTASNGKRRLPVQPKVEMYYIGG